MSSFAGTGGRVSRAVVDDRLVKHALVKLAEFVSEAVDREHCGHELMGAELSELERVVADRLEEAVLSVPLPERGR